MSREVPFDPSAICDVCGAVGAYDFMGDLLCPLCSDDAIDGADSDDDWNELDDYDLENDE